MAINKDKLTAIKNPILLKERLTEVDRAKFAAEAGRKALAEPSKLTAFREIQSKRSPQSQAMDNAQKHILTLKTDDKRTTLWLRNQGNADIQGVDTPRVRTIRITTEHEKTRPPKMHTPKMRAHKPTGKEVSWLGRGIEQSGRRRHVK